MDETPKQEFARLRQLELHVSDFLWAVDNNYFESDPELLHESVFVFPLRQFSRK